MTQKNVKTSSLMFDLKEKKIYSKLIHSLDRIDEELQKICDFTIRLQLRAISPFFPDFIMSKYRDDIVIYKRGSSIRVDFSLYPKGSNDVTHRKSTMLYNPLNIEHSQLQALNKIALINHEGRKFFAPFSCVVHKEKQSLLKDIFYEVSQQNKSFNVSEVNIHNVETERSISQGLEKVDMKFTLLKSQELKKKWEDFPSNYPEYFAMLIDE